MTRNPRERLTGRIGAQDAAPQVHQADPVGHGGESGFPFLLALHQGLLGVAAVGDVDDDALVMGNCAVGIAADHGAVLHPAGFAASGDEAVGLVKEFVRQRVGAVGGDLGGDPLDVVRVDDGGVAQVIIPEIRWAVTENGFHVFRDQYHWPTGGVPPQENHRRTPVDDLVSGFKGLFGFLKVFEAVFEFPEFSDECLMRRGFARDPVPPAGLQDIYQNTNTRKKGAFQHPRFCLVFLAIIM